jgi:hypothetical protein
MKKKMIINKQKVLRFIFFIFLFLHTIPLVFRENYQLITVLNYSIILGSLVFLLFNKEKLNLFLLFASVLVLISLILSFLGFSGSVLAYILAASLPYFLFKKIKSDRDFLNFFYLPVILSSIFLLIFSGYLFYNIRNDILNIPLIGSYFVIASINIVPLLFFAFSILYFVLLEVKKRNSTVVRFEFFFLLLLLFVGIFLSFIFSTRSVFIVSLIILVVHIRKYVKVLTFAVIIFMYYNMSLLFEVINILFGSASFIELAFDVERTESIMDLIVMSMNLGYDFRNNMSYSSLFNLLFSLFPFTLIFLPNILITPLKIIKKRMYHMIFIFGGCLLVTLFQMDFLSIFILFFLIESINHLTKTKLNTIQPT